MTHTPVTEISTAATKPYLHVLGGPFVTIGTDRSKIPDCCERLVVWLALRRSRASRGHAAGVFWPMVDDRRAAGNLRSALWRLRGARLDLVDSDHTSLALRADVVVDVHAAGDWAQRVLGGSARDSDLTLMPWFDQAMHMLPGWGDDWLVLERERLRHRVLHAYERLSRLLCDLHRYADAVTAAETAVAANPLRQTAQRVLIEAHLANGDLPNARWALEAFTELHRRELGVDPAPNLPALIPSRRNRHRGAIFRPC